METLKQIDRFNQCTQLTDEKLNKALDKILGIIDANIQYFDGKFPQSASTDNIYGTQTNEVNDWTQGFWPGILWLAYQLTDDEKYKNAASRLTDTFVNRIDNRIFVEHHDMGFLFSLSCVADYKLTGSEKAKNAAIKAADTLIERYHEKGGFIQAWGKLDEQGSYRMIVDCLLNIPLLYWASEVTGDGKYEDIAYRHFNSTAKNILRDEGSTFHTFYFDINTGEPLYGKTAQGASDDSCWARGQAWAVYGFILTYLYKHNENALGLFKEVSNFFLNRLPEDYVAYWDLIFTEGDEERDSSAASTAACGLLAGAQQLQSDDEYRELYTNAAKHIINSLIDSYMPECPVPGNGLLLHGVYAKPMNRGIDECTVWGDYFFMEALARIIKKDGFINLW